jgi:ankyrin repeat protein
MLRSLVNIDAGDHTVKLIHASAKEFLLSTHSYSPSYASLLVDASFANTYIARSCLTYLCFSDISLIDANEDQESSLNKLRAHLNAWQFLEYASVNWSLHLDPTSPQGIHSFRRLYSSDWNTVKWIELVVGLGSSSWAHTSGREYSIIDTLKSFQLSANLASDNNYERWLIHLDGPPDGRQSRWQRFIDVKLPSECLPILHISAFFDFVTFTQSLIEKGTSVNQRCYLGRTTLHQAARLDAVSTAKMLVQAKANINARDDRGATPLIYAVDPGANLGGRTGRFLVGSLLLEAGADVCAITVSPLTTALTLACYTPRPDDEHVLKLVTSLLDHGATKIINVWDNRTPLVEAAKNSSYKLLRTLLHYGASVDIVHGKDHNDTIGTPLIQLCDIEDSAIMCILLDAGANIHARDFDGRTCLHKTARLKSLHASKLLLDHGADVNAIASSDGSLPIHDAVRENCTEQIELLLKHKTKLEAEDGIGRTPLDIAVENKSVEAAQMLLKAGANPNRRHTYIEIKNKQLQVKGHERVYQPQTSRDLFHVYHMLVRGHRTPLPHGIAISIIKLAEYFLKTQSTRSEYKCIVERNGGQPYLRSAPITGNVQMIAFTIESHDQGFSSYPQDRGTYNNSWAWFEVGVVNMMGMEVPIGGQKTIQNNVHASRKKRRHVVVYGKGKHMNNAEWLQSLSQGDTVMVVPFARYNGWENHVYSVKIEVYTVNLRD